jgi:hypothetical protein
MIRIKGEAKKKRTATPSAKKAERASVGVPVIPVSAVDAAIAEEVGGSLLIRGVSDDLLKRLERARAERGLRSRNAAVLEILAEGAPK